MYAVAVRFPLTRKQVVSQNNERLISQTKSTKKYDDMYSNTYPAGENVLDVKHVTLSSIIRLIQLFMEPVKDISSHIQLFFLMINTINMLRDYRETSCTPKHSIPQRKHDLNFFFFISRDTVMNTYFASLSRAIFSTSPTEYALQ